MVSNFKNKSKEVPTQTVREMRQKGLSDNQIIQSLQHEGYNSQETLEAMEMADMNQNANAGFVNSPPPQMPMRQQPASISPMPPPMGQMNNQMQKAGPMPPSTGFQNNPISTPGLMPPPMGFPNNTNHPTSQPSEKHQIISSEEMEELIEAIIDEKWAEVERDIGRIIEWKDGVEERIGNLTAQITNLKSNYEDLHGAIVGKVGDYDKNILNVGIQLKAMEEVFSKVLPTFTDNVTELNRIADKLKGR